MVQNQVTVDMDKLRALVRDVVLEVLADLADDNDPDAGLEFKPEVAAYLEQYKKERPAGTPLSDVIKELGLDA